MSIKKIIPEIVCWESTLACNFNCQHCGLNARTARDNELNSRKAENMLGIESIRYSEDCN